MKQNKYPPRIIVKTNITGKSYEINDCGVFKSPGYEAIEAAPNMPKLLNKLDPKTFPIAMSACPFRAAAIEAEISGNEVP